MSASARRRLGWILAATFALCMLMGPGPGVLLVNSSRPITQSLNFWFFQFDLTLSRPSQVLGLPVIYVWGLFWYAVQVTVIVTAYLLVWRDPDRHV